MKIVRNMHKYVENRYKLMKICINILINIKISAYFVVKYHTFVVNYGKFNTLLW